MFDKILQKVKHRNDSRAGSDATIASIDTVGGGSTVQVEPAKALTKGQPVDRTGLFLLYEPEEKASINIDIVAVHGLLANAFDAWQEDDTLWLRDQGFLPKFVPTARILTYGYNSSVALSQSVSGVSQFAETLLNFLEQERRSDQEKSRPLLFICHNLGGIVVKKVLAGLQAAFKRS